MNIQNSYNQWASIYDTNINKTRDLEGEAIRKILNNKKFDKILEIGCGTGKNTEFLHTITNELLAIDFSVEMLQKAKERINTNNVKFEFADITKKWNFAENNFDLVTFSLILEHIENLDFVFSEANKTLKTNGLIYIGELHPFKQYEGSKAKFEINNKTIELECFTRNISDFFKVAQNNNFECLEIDEWFDSEKKTPRILTLLLKKINY